MPELPEAEVVTRQVRGALLGAMLEALWIGRPDIIRQGLSTSAWYVGSRLQAVERRGKSVVLRFGKDRGVRYIVAELGMTGLLLFASAAPSYDKHTHVRLAFTGGGESLLRYWNPRRFGRMSFLDEEELAAYTARRFGLDPLRMTWEAFRLLLRSCRGRIKTFLMHQQDLAGIGNIYANEILYRAGIHPARRADRLSDARARALYGQIQAVLNEAIEYGGSSIRDFLAPNGACGRFASRHLVYNHAQEPCPSGCGGRIRIIRRERASFYCPRCQR